MRFFLRLLPARNLLALPTIRWLILSRFCTNLFDNDCPFSTATWTQFHGNVPAGIHSICCHLAW